MDKKYLEMQAQISELKRQNAELTRQNTELDAKLTDAYQINARAMSLEAEKIRFNLQKEFSFLLEDYKEFNLSECSENNYESLQAIIKKCFRAVERSTGVKF